MSIPQRIAPSAQVLRDFYLGKDVHDVPKPAAVLDVAKIRRHCQSMLDAVESLGVGFRAHVKTHKTKEVARLQAGEKSQEVNFIVSTVAEIEHLLPVFDDFKQAGRRVNVLYGVPLLGSQVVRLAALSKHLGHNGLAVIVDHPSQLESVGRLQELGGFPVGVFLKVDTGYHRAGLPAAALNKGGLLAQLVQLDAEGRATLLGLYSHSSLSYKDTTADQAMHNLADEIEGCLEALHAHADLLLSRGPREITVSVGASPQVTSIENLTARAEGGPGEHRLRAAISSMTMAGAEAREGLRPKLELHAGVYSVLDMQQVSTRSRTSLGGYEDEVAITVAAEVCSVYNDGERAQPEVLVAVGTLGLGREPCPSYSGWGVTGHRPFPGREEGRRLVVERISQEHSVLSWDSGSGEEEGPGLPPIPLEVGQTVDIYPNHACVTGALYGWYLVVDSSRPDKRQIVDVWVRGSGW
ncbi:Alanine racemase domain protein [Colletotrichum higginsianum IMI 349063]|uniref:Alanine racemase domain protein n=2 Tax=Colletotrichum higginsianum TaxID=80884 RepID=A0A1B7XS77_COLHI|nr:Alanine racemase domain protein [Colletotrichum higginsianum IMI 349063]OBR02609.1 Alanine racemase domain protein [Colletotrichum higginsianum IMI 349063]TID06692.1 D-serine dehydratase [Colletotrichum higginsianum]